MKQVAKLVIVDKDNNCLLLNLNNHPAFGNDADLPGGTLDDGELPIDGMIREVQEEIGVDVKKYQVEEIYSGTDYSAHGTHYTLFSAKLDERPELTLSWEHTSYKWVSLDELLDDAKNATDTYMHMVHDTLKERRKKL
jgi:8-oxo-dGTP diphosphatase